MSIDAAIIEESLEIVASRCDDIVPLVYRRFYVDFPDTRSMFGRDKNNFHQGQMLNGMLLAIIEHAQGRCKEGSIRAWVMDHDALGVRREMFPAMFGALFETLQFSMGDSWNEKFSSVWTRQINGLAALFEDAYDHMELRRRKVA